eukprot:6201418-Pleurochrysis_carterae.AAC.3
MYGLGHHPISKHYHTHGHDPRQIPCHGPHETGWASRAATNAPLECLPSPLAWLKSLIASGSRDRALQ